MAIQQCANNAAIQYTGKSLMMGLGVPFRNDIISVGETPNMETLLILRPAAETDPVG
jgi:hypothetical protein